MMDDRKHACLLIGFLLDFQNEDLQKPSPDTNFTTPEISEPISEEPGAWVILGMSCLGVEQMEFPSFQR